MIVAPSFLERSFNYFKSILLLVLQFIFPVIFYFPKVSTFLSLLIVNKFNKNFGNYSGIISFSSHCCHSLRLGKRMKQSEEYFPVHEKRRRHIADMPSQSAWCYFQKYRKTSFPSSLICFTHQILHYCPSNGIFVLILSWMK